MTHFLEISQCTSQCVSQLIERALVFKQSKDYPAYPNHAVALLFYENSTRTRISFELAAKRLGMQVVHVDLQHSSEAKGEVIEDTIRTLAAMGIRYFVLRHKQEGIQQYLAERIAGIHLINAGDGTHAHPSQALLDMMTVMEQKPQLSALKIVILGNIRHSRVARSFQAICQHFKVNDLVLVAPTLWLPEAPLYGRMTSDLKEGLAHADVIMCLRVQTERLAEHEQLNLETYRQQFALTQASLRDAKSDVMVLHPGPMNRGVEIDSEVADGPHSFILEQVTNGVFARMAVLEALIKAMPCSA